MCDNCIKGLEKVTNAFCEKCHGTGILTLDLLDNQNKVMSDEKESSVEEVDAVSTEESAPVETEAAPEAETAVEEVAAPEEVAPDAAA